MIQKKKEQLRTAGDYIDTIIQQIDEQKMRKNDQNIIIILQFYLINMQNQLQHPTVTLENVNQQAISKSHQHHKIESVNPSEEKKIQKQKQQQASRPEQEPIDSQQTDTFLSVEMLDYFQTMLKKHGSKQAYYMSYLAENAICSGIETGQVYLSEDKASLDQILMQSRAKQKEDKTKKQEQEQKKRALIQMQLKYLDMQIAQGKRAKSKEIQQDNQFNEDPHNNAVFSKKQHKQFLQRIVKQRSQLSLRKKSLEEKQKGKQEQQQKQQKILQEQQEQRQREQKKKRILQKLEEQKQKHEQKIKEEEQKNRRLSELKSKKFLHEKIQEKYNTQVLLPTLEEKKKKLKEIREMSKAFNVQEINNHQKEYLKKRQEIMSASSTKKMKQQWHYKVPEKSQRLVKLLQQEAIQTKVKMEEKKRKLEQRIQRQQQFAIYLKQKYQPIVDPKKRQQIEERMRLKSESKEQKPKADGKTLGMNYLQEVKKQRKKSANSQLQLERRQTLIEQKQSHRKKSQTNYLNTRKKYEYEQLRDKRIDRLINSQTTEKSQKIMRLQMEANKLIEQQKRKQQKIKLMRSKNSRNAIEDEEGQSTHLLLASIKAKMGIIDIYSKD